MRTTNALYCSKRQSHRREAPPPPPLKKMSTLFKHSLHWSTFQHDGKLWWPNAALSFPLTEKKSTTMYKIGNKILTILLLPLVVTVCVTSPNKHFSYSGFLWLTGPNSQCWVVYTHVIAKFLRWSGQHAGCCSHTSNTLKRGDEMHPFMVTNNAIPKAQLRDLIDTYTQTFGTQSSS